MDYITANVTIIGNAALSQSHQHYEPSLEGESPDDYDKRTWRSKLNTLMVDGKNTVVIPNMALQWALVDGAKFSKKQIEGYGRSTWTQRFQSGVSVITPGVLNVDPDTVNFVTISANVDGRRGSGKRVPRRLPQILPPWEAAFTALILDPMITEEVFIEMLEYAGMFIGVGQFRPQNGGSNGRFDVGSIDWQDNRRLVRKRRAA